MRNFAASAGKGCSTREPGRVRVVLQRTGGEQVDIREHPFAVSGAPACSICEPPPARPALVPLPPNLMAWTPNCSWLKKMYQGNSAQIRPSVMPSAAMTKSLRRSDFFFSLGNCAFGGCGHSVPGTAVDQRVGLAVPSRRSAWGALNNRPGSLQNRLASAALARRPPGFGFVCSGVLGSVGLGDHLAQDALGVLAFSLLRRHSAYP